MELELSALPFVDEAGPALLAIFRDITERQAAELRLAAFSALGERLSAAHTAAEAGQLIVDAADQLLGWEACTLDLYSAAEDRLIHVLNMDTIGGQRVSCKAVGGREELPPVARQVIREGGQLILKENPAEMLAGAKPFGDTSRPSASILIAPIRKENEVIGIVSLHSYTPKAYDQQSLTTLQALADHCAGALERIRLEESLRVSEARFRSIWNDALIPMRLTDAAGTIVMVNRAYCELVGLPREQLEGAPMSVVYPANEHARVLGDYAERFQRGGDALIRAAEVTFRNGRKASLEITETFLHVPGQRPLLLSVMRDVTEARQLEQQLRQAQKMEATGQLAGGVAHDFNNLLAVIQGNAELVLLNAARLPAPAGDCLKQVSLAVDRGANLTRQLLAFSRKQVIQPRPLNLNVVISHLTKMLRRIIGEDIELHCEPAAALPFVQADAGMMEQVLVNLVVNARDAMPRGGQLFIATAPVSLDAHAARQSPEARPGDFVRLTVRDTGGGIPPEHLPRIFDPFFTTEEVGKGTGLGLATVYGIVKQHQGWIDVSSQPGSGSTFQIYLPAIPPPAPVEGDTPGATTRPRGGTETILLVEDDDLVRRMTRQVLENAGYQVLEAGSGREALARWPQLGAAVDLLLTDLVMPEGIGGRELAEQLRAQAPALKILFITGYSAEVTGDNTEFIQRSQGRLLHKPCPPSTLLQAVRDALDTE